MADWYSDKAQVGTGWLALIVRRLPLHCTTIIHLLGTVMTAICKLIDQLIK